MTFLSHINKAFGYWFVAVEDRPLDWIDYLYLLTYAAMTIGYAILRPTSVIFG